MSRLTASHVNVNTGAEYRAAARYRGEQGVREAVSKGRIPGRGDGSKGIKGVCSHGVTPQSESVRVVPRDRDELERRQLATTKGVEGGRR